MARWRITLEHLADPVARRKVHRQHRCKLCMIYLAMTLACEMAGIRNVPVADISWELEKLTGVVDGWNIVYTSRMPTLTKVKRHACR